MVLSFEDNLPGPPDAQVRGCKELRHRFRLGVGVPASSLFEWAASPVSHADRRNALSLLQRAERQFRLRRAESTGDNLKKVPVPNP